MDRSRTRRSAAYYDENGRSLKRFMLRTPLQVRAASHVRLLAQPVASGASAPIARISASTTARRSVRRSSRSRRAPSCPRDGPAAAATRCGFGTRRLRDATTCTSRRSDRHPRRRARGAGSADRPGRRDGHGDRSAPRLPAQAERRVREPARRAQHRCRPAIRFRRRFSPPFFSAARRHARGSSRPPSAAAAPPSSQPDAVGATIARQSSVSSPIAGWHSGHAGTSC